MGRQDTIHPFPISSADRPDPLTGCIDGSMKHYSMNARLLGKSWQAKPLKRLADLLECRICGHQCCSPCHCECCGKAVWVAKLVPMLYLCRTKGLSSIRFDHCYCVF
ncbi:MAG: hypothetical protein QOH35_2683 [Acidobacteriaceae bacterium]|jgi:hypothetical protein|nr:hypothetical protein [Acidobacteriaceae bacterium]